MNSGVFSAQKHESFFGFTVIFAVYLMFYVLVGMRECFLNSSCPSEPVLSILHGDISRYVRFRVWPD